MSSDPTSSIHAEAIAWHIRLRDERPQDWDEFADWLECDSRHSSAYDAVALDDERLNGALSAWAHSAATRTNDNRPLEKSPIVSRRWAIGGVGAAAAAAAALLLITPMTAPAEYYDVATAPGEQRLVALDGGGRITLNGGTSIKLDRRNPRYASLTSGEAAFSIVHDAKSPFQLHLGTDRLVDVGTRFNVVRTRVGHKVEVSEGSVLYNPTRQHIALSAGQTLTSKSQERRIVLGTKPVSDVGGWQHGRLSYRSDPLAEVAADLSRSIGTPISVQSVIANRSFTGTIEIDRDETRMFARLGPLLDVDARRSERGWTLGPARNASR